MARHRLRDYKYSHFLRCFKIRRLLFDCSFSFSFTPIDRLWHDACSLDSMEIFEDPYLYSVDSDQTDPVEAV